MTKMVKNRHPFPLFVALLAVSVSSACATAPVANQEGFGVPGNTVQVVGVGEARGTPDIASIQMGVNLVDENLEKVITEANQAVETITEALVNSGVGRNDIQTTNYGIWPEDVYDRMTGEATGERKYHADLTLEVTIQDIACMSEFIQVGLDAGVNNIYGVNLRLDETAALESEARSAAIADARTRARELVSGLGRGLGEPVSISEGVLSAPGFVGVARRRVWEAEERRSVRVSRRSRSRSSSFLN